MSNPATIIQPANRVGLRMQAAIAVATIASIVGPSAMDSIFRSRTSKRKTPDPERQTAAELKRIRKAEKRASHNNQTH